MGLITRKNNLLTGEQVTKFPNWCTSTRMVQGDANSDRVYKYMHTVRLDTTSQLRTTVYASMKYYGTSDKMQEVNAFKKLKTRDGPDVMNSYILRWDFQGELIYYEDEKGNQWEKEWGVELPFELGKKLSIVGKTYTKPVLEHIVFRDDKRERLEKGSMYILMMQEWDELIRSVFFKLY
jgi:hypothetical protein